MTDDDQRPRLVSSSGPAPRRSIGSRFDAAGPVLISGVVGMVVGVLVMVVVSTVSADGSSTASADEPTATVTTTKNTTRERYIRIPGPRVTVSADAEAASSAPPPPPPASAPTTIAGDGTFRVGDDVEPGTSRNDGSTLDGAPCVAYTSQEPNDLGSYIAGSTIEGPGVVVLNDGEWFTTQYCQRWRRS